jgi:hypothetical protein
MKFTVAVSRKQVISVIFVLALVAGSFYGGMQYVLASGTLTAQTISGGVVPGAPSYTVWTEGGYYYTKNGYGLLSYNGTDAGAVLQYALNSLTGGRTSKETVYLKGNFVFSSSVVIPSYTKIVVDGSVKLANSFSSSTIVLFSVDGVSNVEITGGDWNGNGANQVANNEYISAIFVSNSNDVALTNMVLHDWGSTVTYGWGINAGYGSQRIMIDHITGYNNGNEVIALNDASDSMATNLILYNNAKFDAGANGIWINSNNITVSHVVGWGHRWGTVRVEANDKDRHGILLSDIVSRDNSKIGISIDKTAVGSWSLYDVVLDGFSVTNTATYGGVFVWAQSAGQVHDITIANGHIDNTIADSGLYLNNIANVTVSNVDVKNSYKDGITAIYCTNLKVIGGSYTHNGHVPTFDSDITFAYTTNSKVIGASLTDSTAYGFREDTGCSMNIISDCTSSNNAGIFILDGVGSKVLNSYNGSTWTPSSNVFSGIGHTSSSTYVVVTFPHDLGYAPNMIYITMADFGYTYYWVNATSSSSFRLNVLTSGTYYFLWEVR